MARKRRKYSRSTDTIFSRKLFVISTEGAKTEPAYFNAFNSRKATVIVKPLPVRNAKSSPEYVLKRMKQYITDKGIKSSDEAWLVVDKDEWTEEQLKRLFNWTAQADNYHLALSNPKFEYWILLHFENGQGISNSKQCSDKLKSHLPNYEKNVIEADIQKIMLGVREAITRAEAKDKPKCKDWSRKTGTTVYRLVKKIVNE